ncbi:MAG: flagellar basal body P-ring formation protein FlgA [Rhodobacteraceae bacterium]|nr:flagellar basal body P-ring formation protein FlgA [Paracoccaceae bacterium]
MNRFIDCIRTVFAAALLTFSVSAAADDGDMDRYGPTRLIGTVNVQDSVVRLGDLFAGAISSPGRIVAQAPAPGQRIILHADWLASLARTNGLDWRPNGPYDRAMVYRPGQTVAPRTVLAAIKDELVRQGMPENFGLRPELPLGPVTIDAAAPREVGVREPYFDPASGMFSAVAELPAGDPNAIFVPMRGFAVPSLAVPMPRDNIMRDTMITSDMIEMVEIPESSITGGTIVDPAYVIGKAAVAFLKAGEALSTADVAQLTLVEVPVLRREVRRGEDIPADAITWTTVNADTLPADAVLDEDYLIGMSPRRYQPAGVPMRRGDLQTLRKITVAVAARDMRRGAILDRDDVNWITVNDSDVSSTAIVDVDAVMGRELTSSVRAGQTLRAHDVAVPRVMEKGKLVTVLFSTPLMQLTARGLALEPGGIGETIRVMNDKSNTQVFAEIVDADTVRVISAQMAMN